MELPFDILHEDNHCLAVNKPAGMLTTGFQGQDEPIDRFLKRYLKARYHKPGNVFLGVVHRLDKPVSGVVIYARTSKGAARLSDQFRAGSVEKVYWAVVEGRCTQEAGTLEDWLRKNHDVGRVEVLPPDSAGARHSVLHFQKRGGDGNLTWLEIRPQTGRTHQIRVQLASRNHPIYGDVKYGSVHTFGRAIALHARALTFLHPIRHEPVTLTAELPESWRRFHPLGVRVKP